MEKILVRCPSCSVFLNIVKKDSDQSLTCPRCQFRGIVSQFPVVIPKKLTCPSCKTVISVDPERKGMLVCPHCKQERDVANYLDAAMSKPESGARTELPVLEQGGALSRPGVLVWEKGETPTPGQMLILKKGINSLGRGEQCSIRIETVDTYISRQHACIELAEKNGMFEHILSDSGSVNGTYHNEARLGKGDAVILKPNDRIRFGRTTYKFTLT